MAASQRIFVSIAAYRDPEVGRTVRDLIARAVHPEALTIAVFDQNEKRLRRPKNLRGAKLIIEHCPPQESRGACWTRAQLHRHLDGEDFFLQLDSHHLFKPRWDELALEQLAACASERPVLTGYLPPYELRPKPGINAAASLPMQVSHFDDDGVIIYRSHSVREETPGPPMPSRFFSGHFAFSRREFVEAVPYDPELYFYGEESSMAARAFTHGFDLFHPGTTIAWHHYVRKGTRRHWDDHQVAEGGRPAWQELQRRGVFKYNRLFCLLPHISAKDGLGVRRSLAQYEAWAGVDHYWRITHPSSAELRPPPASAELNWTVSEGLLTQAEICVALPPLASVDPRPCKQVHLAVLDATTRDAAARRVTPEEYEALRQTGWRTALRFRSAPLRLVVWPLIADVGWGEKHQVHLNVPSLAEVRPACRK